MGNAGFISSTVQRMSRCHLQVVMLQSSLISPRSVKFQVVKIPNSLVHQLTEDEKKALDAFTPEQKQKVTDEMKVLISKFLYIKKTNNNTLTKDAVASDCLFSFSVK